MIYAILSMAIPMGEAEDSTPVMRDEFVQMLIAKFQPPVDGTMITGDWVDMSDNINDLLNKFRTSPPPFEI